MAIPVSIPLLVTLKMSSTFSNNSEAFASELFENLEEMFPHNNVIPDGFQMDELALY